MSSVFPAWLPSELILPILRNITCSFFSTPQIGLGVSSWTHLFCRLLNVTHTQQRQWGLRETFEVTGCLFYE